MLLFYYLLGTLILWLLIAIYLLANMHKVRFLGSMALTTQFPKLAIIIAVRNEEENLEAALKSVCAINYPNYEIFVVNDRSTDSTGEILRKVSTLHPQIKIIDINELPPFWLGKNHALYQGYLKSSEEWMLFTDADIVFEPDSIKRAMYYATENHLDHLTIMPDVNSRSILLNSILRTFFIMLNVRLRPWALREPNSSASMGVGAFNMVKRTAYEAAGTHKAIKLRPDDDLKLGELIKKAGKRSDALYGDGQLKLEWYPSISEFINGLMKNTFAVANYNVPLAIAGGFSVFMFFTLPIPLALISGSITNIWIGAAILIVQFVLLQFMPGKGRWWDFLTVIYAGLVMTYVIFKSTYLTLKNKGIYWRDSFYSLEDLKREEGGRESGSQEQRARTGRF